MSSAAPEEMALPDSDRFARQRAIEGWDQDKIAAATAVVVGVGALGNEVAKNLALAGVGRLILCDFDHVDETNLSRGVLFRPTDVGRPKVDAAADTLRSLAPGTVVETRCADLDSGVGLGEIADAAVIVGCLDSVLARLRLLGRCALVDAAYVDGGTRPWGGEVRLRLSADDPCYSCSLPPEQRGESDLPWSCADQRTFGPQAASIGSSALVAAWMSVTALRVVIGAPPGYRFLVIDGLEGHTGEISVERDPECPHHHLIEDGSGAVNWLDATASGTPLTSGSTISDLLAALPQDAEPLAWTSFPPNSPSTCGHHADYGGVTNDGTHSGICQECGQPVWQRPTSELRRAAPSAVLADLGVAPEEILPVQMGEGRYQWLRLKRTAFRETKKIPMTSSWTLP